MVLAITAIFDVVQIVAGLFAQQAKRLGTCHMELLLATGLVALHAGADMRLRAFTQICAYVADCK